MMESTYTDLLFGNSINFLGLIIGSGAKLDADSLKIIVEYLNGTQRQVFVKTGMPLLERIANFTKALARARQIEKNSPESADLLAGANEKDYLLS
jgi:hypothetical protein